MRLRLLITASLFFLCLPLEVLSQESPEPDAKMAKMKQLMAENTERREEASQKKEESIAAGLTSWDKSSKPEEVSPGSRMFQGLSLCLGFFLVGVYFYKRLFPSSNKFSEKTGQNLKIVDRVALTGGTSLILVQVGKEKTLLSVGSEQVQVLQQVTGSDQIQKSIPILSTDAKEECPESIKLSA